MNLFILISLLTLGFARDLDPGDPNFLRNQREKNLSNKTISIINLILIIFTIFCVSIEDLRIFGVFGMLFIMIFTVSAEDWDYDNWKKTKITMYCNGITNFKTKDAFSAIYPSYFATAATFDEKYTNLNLVNVDLDKAKIQWLDAIIEKLKFADDEEQFFKIVGSFYRVLDGIGADCAGLKVIMEMLKYVEKRVEKTTFKIMADYLMSSAVTEVKLRRYQQVMMYIQSFWKVVVPFEFTFTTLDYVLIVISVSLTIMMMTMSKFKRKLGEIGIVGMMTLIVIVLGIMMARF